MTGEKETFTIQPPDFKDSSQRFEAGGYLPTSAEAAWILQIIQTKLDLTNQVKNIIDATELPDSMKDAIFKNLSTYLDNASLTHIQKSQIPEFLMGFRCMWGSLCIYVIKTKKYAGVMHFIRDQIEELLVMNLNKSIEGWLGDLIFTKRASTVYDIRQKSENPEKTGWLIKKKTKEVVEEK